MANGGNSNGGHGGNANAGNAKANGNGDDQSMPDSNTASSTGQEHNDKQTICINTAVNHAGSGFVSETEVK
jgi:hypothetical protein